MGYGTDGLTFNILRSANKIRMPLFKNARGEPARTELWTDAQWLQAVVGELGEYANIRKKVDRGDFTIEEAKEDLGKEIADTMIYLDLLAMKLGLDLGEVVMSKFNEVSRRIKCDVRISPDGYSTWPRDDYERLETTCDTCGSSVACPHT